MTTKMVAAIEADWLEWVNATYIPYALQTGCFTGSRLLRMIDNHDEEGPTYAIQFESPDEMSCERWRTDHAEAAMEEAFRRWGNQFITFKSLLEVVN